MKINSFYSFPPPFLRLPMTTSVVQRKLSNFIAEETVGHGLKSSHTGNAN